MKKRLITCLYFLLFTIMIVSSQSKPGNIDWVDKAEQFIEVHKYKQALKILDQQILLSPNHKRALKIRSEIYTTQNKHQLAVDDLSRLIELEYNNTELYTARGFLYIDLNQNNLAIQDFDLVVQLEPTNMFSFYHRGFGFLLMKDFYPGINDFIKALELANNDDEIKVLDNLFIRKNSYKLRGQCYLELNFLKKAEDDFQAFSKLNKDNNEHLILFGNLYLKSENFQKALFFYNKLIDQPPACSWWYHQRGEVYFKSGDFENSKKDYRQALQIEPNSPYPFFGLAQISEKQNNISQAFNFYTKFVSISNTMSNEQIRPGFYQKLEFAQYKLKNLKIKKNL